MSSPTSRSSERGRCEISVIVDASGEVLVSGLARSRGVGLCRQRRVGPTQTACMWCSATPTRLRPLNLVCRTCPGVLKRAQASTQVTGDVSSGGRARTLGSSTYDGKPESRRAAPAARASAAEAANSIPRAGLLAISATAQLRAGP